MFGSNPQPSKKGTKPCRNGPDCYHLKNGDCWFYHPPPQTSLTRMQSLAQQEERQIEEMQRKQRLRRQKRLQRLRRLREQQRQEEELSYLSILRSRRICQMRSSTEQPCCLKQDPDFKCPIESSLPLKSRWFFKRNKHVKIEKNLSPKYESCSICYQQYECENLEANSYLTELFCKHNFHTECIEKWLRQNQKCPLCKHDFRDYEGYAQWDKDYKTQISK